MPASKRKRLRLARENASSAGPLGSASAGDPDAGKDDEERELESFLFGKPFVPSSAKGKAPNVESKSQLQNQSSGLEHMLDEELFFIDDTQLDGDAVTSNYDEDEVGRGSADGESSSDVSDSDEDGTTSSSSSNSASSVVQPTVQPSTRKKTAVWSDAADMRVTVSLATDKRLRKLRDAPTEDEVTGKVYESKLRRQYEKINPVPEWAINARAKLHKRPKRRRDSSPSNSDGDEDVGDHQPLDDLLRSTGGVLSSSSKSKVLPSEMLAIERLRDANQAAPSEGPISAVRFHPSPSVPVLLTTGTDRRLRLFNIDGLTNPLLQTIHIPDLVPNTALFHPSGSSILLTGPRPYYYTHDLQSGSTVRSPRSLWHGATGAQEGEDRSLETAKFSPDGRTVAIGGRRGYVHLLDWSHGAGGGGQVVGSVKMHSGVKDVCWAGGANGARRELLTLGQDAEVYLWDLGSRKCIARWKDDGAFGPNCLEGGSRGDYYAIGSKTGIVNIYGPEAATIPSISTGRRSLKPLKTVTNLTTSITSVRIDNTSQMMAIASRAKKDQLRLVHLPTLTTFANWPTSGTPLGSVTSVDFSAGSEFVAIGNTRGRVMLYYLRHFGAGF